MSKKVRNSFIEKEKSQPFKQVEQPVSVETYENILAHRGKYMTVFMIRGGSVTGILKDVDRYNWIILRETSPMGTSDTYIRFTEMRIFKLWSDDYRGKRDTK